METGTSVCISVLYSVPLITGPVSEKSARNAVAWNFVAFATALARTIISELKKCSSDRAQLLGNKIIPLFKFAFNSLSAIQDDAPRQPAGRFALLPVLKGG